MDNLRIIPVTNEELILSVSAMAEEIWHEHYDKLIRNKQVDYMLEKFLSPEAIRKEIEEENYEFFLISYDYTFAGFSAIQETDGSLFLSKLYIHEDFRKKHISSEMLRKYIELCKLRNLDKIWLTVNKHNFRSIDVYKHFGFETVREECNDIGDGYVMDDYIMELSVKQSN